MMGDAGSGRPSTGPRLEAAGTRLRHFHVCAFFNTREEEYQVLGPFYRDALRRGGPHLHFLEPGDIASGAADEHRDLLRAIGIDGAACEHCGQLSLQAWPAPVEASAGGRRRLDVDALLQVLESATAAGVDEAVEASGDGGLRVMGRMGWAIRGDLDRLDLLEYEARANEVLDRNRQAAICVYDLASLDGATMMDLLRTHPLTLIGGVLRENPFFTPPAEMLRELSARRVSGRRRGPPALAMLSRAGS
ncbi:MEDS domain-containing protein [Roseateles aquatilis]|nr:MEDS domain-containing protein [Roseateles aquatilis]